MPNITTIGREGIIRTACQSHVNPMSNPQLALPTNVDLKQKVDACKRANYNLQNLGLPTSNDC